MFVEHVQGVITDDLWFNDAVSDAVAKGQFQGLSWILYLWYNNAWCVMDVGWWVHFYLEASYRLGDAGDSSGASTRFLGVAKLCVAGTQSVNNGRFAYIRHSTDG